MAVVVGIELRVDSMEIVLDEKRAATGEKAGLTIGPDPDPSHSHGG